MSVTLIAGSAGNVALQAIVTSVGTFVIVGVCVSPAAVQSQVLFTLQETGMLFCVTNGSFGAKSNVV